MIEKTGKISKLISVLIVFLCCIAFNISVFANEIEVDEEREDLTKQEYTEDYKKWLSLSDEEKQKVMEPLPFEVKYKKQNELDFLEDELPEKFDLREVLAEKGMPIEVKQQNADNCWAFAILGTLETNLALTHNMNIDLSERHMDYALSWSFTETNIHAFERSVGKALSIRRGYLYLINGIGAVAECNCEGECDHDLKTPNNDTIVKKDLSYLTAYDIAAYAEDYVLFPRIWDITEESVVQDIAKQVKRHIMNYGSVIINTSVMNFIDDYGAINPETAATVVDDSFAKNHAVTIVGWDDNYDKSNFLEEKQPSTNGAWIIRNSWGDQLGDKGYYYMSYDNKYILSEASGIKTAKTIKEYDNLYQNDMGLGIETSVSSTTPLYRGSVYDTNNQGEKLYKVSTFTYDNSVCKVYIDPDFQGEPPEDINTLYTEGKTYYLHPGYNTIYLDNLVELGDKFAIYFEYDKGNGEENIVYGTTTTSETITYSRIYKKIYRTVILGRSKK